MSQAVLGIIFTLAFVLIESAQFVFFGSLFQRISPLLFGFLVFGICCFFFLIWTRFARPEQWRVAMAHPGLLLAVNLGAVVTFMAYLHSVKLIEPAITYTVSAGVMPLSAYAFYRLGFREGEPMRNGLEIVGNGLILVAIVSLIVAALTGHSGFVRGGIGSAVAGVALAILDGGFFTLILVYSQRLSRLGLGPGSVLGLRLPLYVLATGTLAFGSGAGDSLPQWSELTWMILIGLVLTVPPLYLLQKAVPLVSTLTMSALTALGPLAVFSLQWLEGRVNFAPATLSGLVVYTIGAVLMAWGAVRGETIRYNQDKPNP